MKGRSAVLLSLAAAAFAVTSARAEEAFYKGDPMLQTIAPYSAASYPRLSRLPGFSSKLLADHLKLYEGYVKNTNTLAETLAALLTKGKERTAESAELKRRFGWEFNGMRMHELYFENMARPAPPAVNNAVYKRLWEDFSGFDAWRKDFAATGAMRGVGWAVLYQDNMSGRLFNVWVNEHDGGHLAGCTPLLVMDVFEHAYLADYGLDREKYIEAFINVIDWERVEQRGAR